MNCKGRLRRHFPGPSVTAKRSLITDPTFRQPFVDLIVKLDRETGPRKKEEVERAKKEHIGEEIHAVDPWRVTEMVTGFLRGLGQTSEVERISKNTREEALWEGKQLPWRRSPLWLLIRVSLQVTFERSGGQVNSHSELVPIYKDFMVFLMSYILGEAWSQKLPHDLLYVIMAKISRRLMKLKPGKKAKWLGFTEKTMQEVGAMMNQNWENIQSGVRDTLDLSALQTLDFARDTLIAMDNLRTYLNKISSQGHATNIPKAKVVEGPSFQRNEKNYLPKSGFSQDREFMFYELADFENWVGSNLEKIWALDRELPTHGAGVNGAHPHETAGKQLGPFTTEVNLFPFLIPRSFPANDTETEDGYTIPGLESSAVKHFEVSTILYASLPIVAIANLVSVRRSRPFIGKTNYSKAGQMHFLGLWTISGAILRTILSPPIFLSEREVGLCCPNSSFPPACASVAATCGYLTPSSRFILPSRAYGRRRNFVNSAVCFTKFCSGPALFIP